MSSSVPSHRDRVSFKSLCNVGTEGHRFIVSLLFFFFFLLLLFFFFFSSFPLGGVGVGGSSALWCWWCEMMDVGGWAWAWAWAWGFLGACYHYRRYFFCLCVVVFVALSLFALAAVVVWCGGAVVVLWGGGVMVCLWCVCGVFVA